MAAASLLLFVQAAAFAAPEAKVEIQTADTIKSVLERQLGKKVKLRVEGSEDLSGTVARVGDKVVQLTEVTGAEFFDAIVDLEAINAIIVKAR